MKQRSRAILPEIHICLAGLPWKISQSWGERGFKRPYEPLALYASTITVRQSCTKEDLIGDGDGYYLIERKVYKRKDPTGIGSGQEDTVNISNGVQERYYNLECPTGDEKVDELLAYFKDSDPYYRTENFPRIVERVKHFKIHKRGVNIMCEIADRIRNEGKIEGMIRAILELLEEFGQVPKQIVERINAEDNLGVLSRWLKSAAKAGSITEFEANM